MNNIPHHFILAGNDIKVIISDKNPTNEFGNWNCASNSITIYTTIKIDDVEYELSEEQLLNTFYHELFHCFQFYYNNEEDEAQAQVYANFMREFIITKDYEI